MARKGPTLPEGEIMLAALVASAILVQSVSTPTPAAVDTMVDVGGYRVHCRIHRGTIPLTILMETGGAATLASYGGLDSVLARRTGATIIAYERAGFGDSELGALTLDPIAQVKQSAMVLERLRAPSRRIVVGHSYGGLMTVVHADLYQDQVAGVVLVDPMNSRFVDATGDFVYSTVPHITEPKNDRERAIARLVNTFDTLLNTARVAEPKIRAPMVVITSSRSMWNNREREDRAWRASHEAIVAAAPKRRLVVAENSGHQIALDRPDTIIDAVVSLVENRTR
jgi:pimeloyl-ACP methyl ester carboxylesterase